MHPAFNAIPQGLQITLDDVQSYIEFISYNQKAALRDVYTEVAALAAATLILDVAHGRRSASSDAYGLAKSVVEQAVGYLPSLVNGPEF